MNIEVENEFHILSTIFQNLYLSSFINWTKSSYANNDISSISVSNNGKSIIKSIFFTNSNETFKLKSI